MRTFSSFMGRKVVTETGRKVGYCHDLRGELTGRTLTVTGLCVGAGGLVEHFGLRSHSRHNEVLWSSVVRIEGSRIIVRDARDALPAEAEAASSNLAGRLATERSMRRRGRRCSPTAGEQLGRKEH
jgi:sporulation protein YlmC with PRC-barrel domain